MAEVTNAVLYEALLALDQQMASLGEEIDDCKRETRAIQAHLDRTRENVQDIHVLLGRNDGHLTRIEHRLGIVEAGG